MNDPTDTPLTRCRTWQEIRDNRGLSREAKEWLGPRWRPIPYSGLAPGWPAVRLSEDPSRNDQQRAMALAQAERARRAELARLLANRSCFF